jgi:acetyltransferase
MAVRRIDPADRAGEAALLRGLSPQSRYNRFLGGGVVLTPARLEELTRLEFGRDTALAATVMLDQEETIVGIARYVRLDDTSCECAIVVADLWQGYGIGRKLLASLAECARQEGVRSMHGDVLAMNTQMLRLARSQGGRIEIHPDGAQLRRVVFDLR